ncbi:AAA family ATPase [Candidatus Woesearchaeota archaeon]|nr:AAA family ATPase [Candidatus Woesearchaeota archaeon]
MSRESKIIGIISIKGGVGKTSVTANIGAALAQEFNKNVIIVDANFSAPNLGLHFGLTQPSVTLHDVLSNKVDIGDAIHEYDKHLHLVPGSLLNEKINPYALREKVKKLKAYYDVILLDSSPNLNDELRAVMLASDQLLVVTNPDFPTLSTTMHAVKVARQKRTPIVGLVLNRVRGKSFELSVEEIEESCGVPIIGVLPEAITMPESVAETTPATLYKPHTDVAVEFKKIAAALIDARYRDPRFFAQFRNLFRTDPRKEDVNRDMMRKGILY